MLRRIFWFAVGIGLGFGLSVWLARSLRRTAERYTPESIADRLVDALAVLGRDLREAVREGREAMAEREQELRASVEHGGPAVGGEAPSTGNGWGAVPGAGAARPPGTSEGAQ